LQEEARLKKAIRDIEDKDPEVKRLAAKAILRYSPDPEEAFKSILENGDRSTAFIVYEILYDASQDFSSIFLKATEDPDPRIRRLAIRYLFRRSRFTLEDGLRWLKDNDPFVRRRVLRYMAWVADRSALEHMARVAIHDDDILVRMEALRLLAVHGSKQDAGHVIKALEDGNLDVRVQAIKTLKEMTGEDFGEPLGASREELDWITARWKGWWEIVEERSR